MEIAAFRQENAMGMVVLRQTANAPLCPFFPAIVAVSESCASDRNLPVIVSCRAFVCFNSLHANEWSEPFAGGAEHPVTKIWHLINFERMLRIELGFYCCLIVYRYK